jgi:hypothetical protein
MNANNHAKNSQDLPEVDEIDKILASIRGKSWEEWSNIGLDKDGHLIAKKGAGYSEWGELKSRINKLLIEAVATELYELAKSFKDNDDYKGYMVKQVISARCKWVSDDGKVHIGISDIDAIKASLKEGTDD